MTRRDTADVSVIVPNYNNGRFLKDFIDSVVNSTMHPLELIVIDDGSTDDSRNILEAYNHIEYLKVILFTKHRGLPAALNCGLDHAIGKYIMRSDPDDILFPSRIEHQFKFMESDPETDVAGANVIYFDNVSKKEINRSNFPVGHKKIKATYKRGEHGVLHPTVIAKATVYKSYRYQDIFPGEDYEIFARMIADGRKFANIREPVNLMRIHGQSSTGNLRFETIRQTFEFRDAIFHTVTSKMRMKLYFYHVRNYRSFQTSNNSLSKFIHMVLATLSYPEKAIKRLWH